MSKPFCVVSCPIDCYSGYSSRSRDFVKGLYDLKKDEWVIKIIPQRWGSTPWGYINDHKEEWGWLMPMLISSLPTRPDYWFQITVPNEFQPIGKWNCGVTAGIETTVADPSWIEGCNRMNLVLTSSKFAKDVFVASKFEKKDEQTNQVLSVVELKTPIEVLSEGVNIHKFFKYDPSPTPDSVTESLDTVPEKFLFLVVGHWMQGELGEDRKNIGYTIKSFLEAFKNTDSDVALLLKVTRVGASILDREDILRNISAIKKSVQGKLPNIYLLHGDMQEPQLNELYNHPKVKTMVTLTKGEGFGRPLIEFSQTKKPIAASAWSGHLDFLSPQHTHYVGGTLTPVHPSAQINNMILPEASWFTPNPQETIRMWRTVYKNYKDYLEPAKVQAYRIKTQLSLEKVTEHLAGLLKTYAPEYKPIVLPKINISKINLPSVRKPEAIQS